MVLPSLIPSYDTEADTLELVAIQAAQLKDISFSWNINAAYTPEGELAELVLLDVRKDSQKILQQALERVGKAGITRADSALVITAAVMLRHFDAIPDLAALPEGCRADAGYLVEYVTMTLLPKYLADRVFGALHPFKPARPASRTGDWLVDSWTASGPMSARNPKHPDVELVRGSQFNASLHKLLHGSDDDSAGSIELLRAAETDERMECWLREEVVPAAKAFADDQSSGLTSDEVRQRQAQRHHQVNVAAGREPGQRLRCITREGMGDLSGDDLTIGCVYDVIEPTDEQGMVRIIDDSGEDYLYPATLFEVEEGPQPGEVQHPAGERDGH